MTFITLVFERRLFDIDLAFLQQKTEPAQSPEVFFFFYDKIIEIELTFISRLYFGVIVYLGQQR